MRSLGRDEAARRLTVTVGRLEQVQAALGEMDLAAPLPRAVQEAMRQAAGRPAAGGDLGRLRAAAAPLLGRRRWQDELTALLLTVDPLAAPWRPLAATLLALQPLERPHRLLEQLERAADTCRLPVGRAALPHEEWQRLRWCLLALTNTDNTATLPLWRVFFMLGVDQAEPEAADPALFLSFVKLLQHRLLSYTDFARAVLFGRALQPETYCGRPLRPPCYHPTLDYLGISRPPYFRLMYRRLVHELTKGGEHLDWLHMSWVRRYSGLAYLRQALRTLASEPSLGALHVARWATDFEDREHLLQLLSGQPVTMLYLLALLRSDLDPALAATLADPGFAAGLRWLRSSPPAAFRQVSKEAPLRAWLGARGHLLAGTAQALTSFKPPDTRQGRLLAGLDRELAERLPGYAEQERLHRLLSCFRADLGLDLADVLSNLDLVRASRGKALRAVTTRARAGAPSALRALALYEPPWRERLLPLLLETKAKGARPAAEAAGQALELVAARSGLPSVAALEERFELQLAWEDAGLAGSESRIWWEVAGCRLKLSITAGRAVITAYGRHGPRKTIPATARRHPDFPQVQAAARQLNATYGRFRDRLEAAMVAGRWFPWEHLRMLLSNAVFRHLFERLVVTDGEQVMLGGEIDPDRPPARLQVVHPIHLAAAGTLRGWQDRLAELGVGQPFKQCFREVYPVEEAERGQAACLRFAGQPLLARKAFALLRAGRWHPRRGVARRDWPERKVSAALTWAAGDPALHHHLLGEQRGEPVFTGPITFHALVSERGRPKVGEVALPLSMVDPVVFSETLREADLLVSLAGAGERGFSSRQTMIIRAAMLRQLARTHKLYNILTPETGPHTIVQGALATYRVHLGSGTIFLEPEGKSITLRLPADLPAPFEEADRGTLRVLLTVLTLARDGAIRDRAFRAQLPQEQGVLLEEPQQAPSGLARGDAGGEG